jgi:uncharacterized damage-inducible protein DinB
MRSLHAVTMLALAASPLALTAQANPVTSGVREIATETGRNLLAAAQAMPAEKFGYKPTPAQMTFGELIAHILEDNSITCTAIGSTTIAAEPKLTPTDAKDKLVAALGRSIAACNDALAKVTDAQLGAMVPYYGHSSPRASAVLGLVADWSDHYSQQAMYLRLNGILPPSARQGGM